MKPNAEQEKALREKIKNQDAAHNKDELRPIENYSISDELKNVPNNNNAKRQKFSLQIKILILLGLMIIAAMGFYWI